MKEFNPDIKSPFSGVASLIKDSATDDEIKLLRFVAYNIYYDGARTSTAEVTSTSFVCSR